MKKWLLGFLIFLIGFILIGWAIFIIAEIDFAPENINVLGNATHNGVLLDDSNSVIATNDSVINIKDFRITKSSYLEMKVTNLNKNTDAVFIDYSNNGFDFLSTVKPLSNGRNIISLPSDSIKELNLRFDEGTRFDIEVLALSSGMPLRYRHIIIFALVSIVWCLMCFYVFIKMKISYEQLVNLKNYSYMLSNLVKKDFALKYRRSVLGVLWSVLNPLLMMAIISAVFSQLFRIQTEHYPVYYLTGAFIFNFMSEATTGSLSAIVSSSSLLKKVYIPKYIFPIESCLFALVNTVFSFIAVIILMPILGVSLNWTLLFSVIPIFYTLVFSIGLGMILSAGNVFFRDIGHLYRVWVGAWMYFTPILYQIDLLPLEIRRFVELNPVHYFVTYFREVAMYNSIPNLRSNLICISFSFAFLLIGMFVFKKSQDKFILYI